MSRDWNLREELALGKRQHLYRVRRIAEGSQGPCMQVDGRECLAFCSNDYLGLAAHPDVTEAFRSAAAEHGVGSGASALVCGHHRLHRELEEALAEFTGRAACLLFSSGYMANLGIITALLDSHDQIFEDRYNHASLIDAGRSSGARFRRYLHADPENLDLRLGSPSAGRRLVVTDGVFSMDGDLAPLESIRNLCSRHKAWLMVDDAHGLGCIGDGGRGTLAQLGLAMDTPEILVGTLGKSFGTSGAFVTGSTELIETLIQHARSYVYTTAPPPAIAAASLVALRLIQQEEWRRTHLQSLIKQFRDGLEALGIRAAASTTPIQPVLLGSSERALRISERLWEAGILVTAMRPPTVPRNTARLRVTLSAAHTPEQVERLLDALGSALQADTPDQDIA